MNIDELKSALKIANGRVTIDSTHPNAPTIKDLINDYYNGQPISIEDAKDVSPKDSKTQVAIQGKSSFLNRPNLPVLATFTLDAKGNLGVVFQYTLIGDVVDASTWKFSDSFPDLPSVFDLGASVEAKQISPLDRLVLTDSYLLVSTNPFEFEKLKVTLDKGISFAGKLTPTGVAGVFERSFSKGQQLTLSGPIVLPKVIKKLPPLQKNVYPWQQNKTLPGIYLTADMGVDIQFGKMEFNQARFHIFSLPSEKWQKENLSYVPALAYTGKFEVKSANISADVRASIIVGMDGVMLGAENISGVSIKNFESLVDISGSDDLGTKIPAPVKDKIQSLQLEAVGVFLAKTEKGLDVRYSFLTIGIPNVDWTAIPKFFTLDSIFAKFMVVAPLTSKPSLTASIGAKLDLVEIPIDVWAYFPNFEIFGKLDSPQNLPLEKLMKKYIPLAGANPPVSDLSVDQVQLDLAPGKYYNLNILMADSVPWKIEMGPVHFTVKDLALDIFASSGDGHTLGGSFSGYIDFIDNLTLQVAYNTPGDVMVRSEVKEITLSQILKGLTDGHFKLPEKFDLTFHDSSVIFSKQGDVYAFMLGTQMKEFGSLAFEVARVGEWGFALAMEIPEGTLEKIPGIGGVLKKFDDVLTLNGILMVVGSIVPTNISFLNLAQFNNPVIKTKKISLPPQSNGLQRGLNVYADINMDLNKATKLIRGFLSLPVNFNLGIALTVDPVDPISNSRLIASLSGAYKEKIKIEGILGLGFDGGDPEIYLTGSLTVPIQGANCEFDLTLMIVADGAELSGDIRTVNHDGKNKSLQFWIIKLREVALIGTIDWEWVPGLGVSAQVDVGTFDSAITVFIDSADPLQSILIGAVSDITLKNVVEELTGELKNPVPPQLLSVLDTIGIFGTGTFKMPKSVAKALDDRDIPNTASAFQQYGNVDLPNNPQQTLITVNKKGELWYVADIFNRIHYELKLNGDSIDVSQEAQLYIVPTDTIIARLPIFRKGIIVNGKLQILSWWVEVKVVVNTNNGISATAIMSPMKIYGEDFLTITDEKDDKKGPIFSVSTFYQTAPVEKELKQPHILFSGKITFLGASQLGAYVFITLSGLEFEFKGKMVDGNGQQLLDVEFDLKATVSGLTTMSAEGSITVKIDKTFDFGKLGSLDFDLDIECDVKVGLKDLEPSATLVKGTFEFDGTGFTLPANLELKTAEKPFANMVGIVEPEVKKVLSAFLLNAKHWLNFVKKKLIKGITQTPKEIGAILQHTLGRTGQQIADDTKAILGYGADEIGQALHGFGPNTAATILRGMYPENIVKEALKLAFPGLHADVSVHHIDTGHGPHLDTPTAPHVDTPGKVHVDTGSHHVDTGHHVDIHSDKHWLPHFHTDHHPHVDTGAPHIDTPVVPHLDHSVLPHVDTKPHVNTKEHIDV